MAANIMTWDEEKAKMLGIDYDPAQYWIDRTNKVHEQLRDRRETIASYEALQTRLDALLEKPRHRVMVPAGKLAMLEGVVVNTNDILAFLGDGWFANRSAAQCKGVISRRLDVIRADEEKLRGEEDDCRKRLVLLDQFAALGGGAPAPAPRKQPKQQKAPRRRVKLPDAATTSTEATTTPQPQPAPREAPRQIAVGSAEDAFDLIGEMEARGEDSSGVKVVKKAVQEAEEECEEYEEYEEDEEEEEEEEAGGVLSDAEIQRRLMEAGMMDALPGGGGGGAAAGGASGAGGILSKLDEMFTPEDVAPPKYANPADIYAMYAAGGQAGQPQEAPRPEGQTQANPSSSSSSNTQAQPAGVPTSNAPAPKGILKAGSRVPAYSDAVGVGGVGSGAPSQGEAVREKPVVPAPQPQSVASGVVGDTVVIRSGSSVPPPPPPARQRSAPRRQRE